MLDGFVIKGNVVEQNSLKAVKGKGNVFKKHSLAISVSIFVHLFLALILFLASEEQQPKHIPITKKAIQSYLYKMPAKPVIVEPEIIIETSEVTPTKEVKKEVKPKQVKQVNKKQVETIKESSLKPSKANEDNKASLSSLKPEKNSAPANFSSYKQLEKLRNSINKQMLEKTPSAYQQYRTPSVMHTDQNTVPHSTIQLTLEQERENKTIKMSDDISITKYDNGVCTIERKQFLGSPVEGSTSAFSCGESKFDKSFREHMKKVRDKIMPKR